MSIFHELRKDIRASRTRFRALRYGGLGTVTSLRSAIRIRKPNFTQTWDALAIRIFIAIFGRP